MRYRPRCSHSLWKAKSAEHLSMKKKKAYSISARRIWLFRFLVLLVLPLLVCALLELVLRVAGVGYPTSIAVPCRIDGRDC